ncbi:AraC family transcriptional regulator [Pendulispora rubella]|uniref:AraC family transcriptional regulator n=1 Tax=Pendulispora rubella TaxID=2741070 RepID=A0ABZ2KX05_9BACT
MDLELQGNTGPIRSQFLVLLFDWLGRNDAAETADSIRRELQLPEAGGTLVRELTVPLASYRTAGDLAAARAGDSFIGLHVARDIPRGSFGLVEFAARSAPDVEEAFHRVVRYLRLLSETIRLELRKFGGEVALVHRIPGEPLCVGRQGNEFTLALFHAFLRELTHSRTQAKRVEFAHSAPDDVGELERFFGTNQLRFDAGRNMIVWSDAILSLPLVSHDQNLLPWLDDYARTLLPADSALDQRIPGLHEQIRQCLQAQTVPTLVEVARRLRLSTRTLQRRLEAVGTSFQAELESVRLELAEWHLRDPKWSIYEIALLLGYADQRGFERAFVKWRGVTPKEYRRTHPSTS